MKNIKMLEYLNVSDSDDLAKLEQRLSDCNRASSEARRIAANTKDANVKDEMTKLADKLDKLAANISFEIENETKDISVDDSKSDNNSNKENHNKEDKDNSSDNDSTSKENNSKNGDKESEDSEDTSDGNESESDSKESNDSSKETDGDTDSEEESSENNSNEDESKSATDDEQSDNDNSNNADSSKESSDSSKNDSQDTENIEQENQSDKVNSKIDNEQSGNEADINDKSEENSNDSNTANSEKDSGEESNNTDSNQSKNDQNPEDSNSNNSKVDKSDDDSSNQNGNNSEDTSSEDGSDSDSASVENNSDTSNQQSSQNSQNQNDNQDDDQNQQSQQPIKNPFTDEDDIPQLSMKGQGQEPKDPDIDDIIKMLKLEKGEAKRGIIDGLKLLLQNNSTPLTEAINLYEGKSLANMSDDEYGDFINDVWDKIKKYSDEVIEKGNDEERQRNNSNMLSDPTAINIEDAANVDVDRKGMIGKYGDEGQKKYGCDTLSDLEFDLWDTINDQIEEYKNSVLKYREDDDEDDVIIKSPEDIVDERKTKPRIEFYIDRSASWGEEKDKIAAEKAINTVQDFADEDLIDLEIFYFDDIITTDETDSLLGKGCTGAWRSILQNIINNQTNNVVIMTDKDMNYAAKYGPAHVVDGKVWWIWRAGQKSDILPEKLKGRLGTGQYMFM